MSTTGKIIVTEATIECRMCPTVVVGKTAEGWTVYCRYRWGHLVVRLDYTDPPNLGGAAGKWILEKQLDPEENEGYISYEELREITSELLEWPQETIPPKFDEDTNDTLLDL